MEKPLRVAYGTPWSSEFIWTRTTDWMLNLEHPPGCEVRYFRGRGWCAARRHNHLCEQAIAWGADLIVILGADQTVPEDALCKFVRHYRMGNQLVGGLVPMRAFIAKQGERPFTYAAWRVPLDANGNRVLRPGIKANEFETIDPSMGDLVRAEMTGTGCIMFPVKALARLNPPWFYEVPDGLGFERKSCTDAPFIARLQKNAGLELLIDTTIRCRHIHPFEIDDTFSERFADWAESGGDGTICHYQPDENQMRRITQARVSTSIPAYKDRFLKRYTLKDYSDQRLPALFFGCYSETDFKALGAHQGPAVIAWAGGDAINLRKAMSGKNASQIMGTHIKHIAISRHIAEDLQAVGLPFVRLPLCCIEAGSFKPTPRTGRNSIYTYLPTYDPEKYGKSFVDRVIAMTPEFNWIVNDSPTAYSQEQMRDIYDRCFIGLRATPHDGLSNTVVEMGLMGRRTIWTGYGDIGTPEQVAEKIRNEYLRDDDYEAVAQEMRQFIDIGEAWKDVSFYEPPKLKYVPADADEKEYKYADYFDFRYEQGHLGAGGPSPGGNEAKWTCDTIRSLLKEHDARSVVEVGCGSMARWDKLPAWEYLGIDVSPKAIEHAKAKFTTAEFVCADATVDAVPSSDAVICIDVLQHIRHEDFGPIMRNMMNAADRVLIIKTTVDLNENYYQFKHDWSEMEADAESVLNVPGVPHSRIFVFSKKRERLDRGSTDSESSGIPDEAGCRSGQDRESSAVALPAV